MSNPATDATQTDEHDYAHDPSHGPRHYITIWAILVVLLIISVLGPLAEIRVVTLITAFGIALVKAFLVCKHFMHLNIQPKFVIYFLVTALAFMGLFVAGVSPDVLSHEGENWVNAAARDQVAAAMAEHAEAEGTAFHADEAFQATCSPCHGTTGAGDGPASAALDPHPANFTDPAFWETRDHDHVVQTITEGGAAVGRSASMPSFGGQFSEEEIQQLADYVESLH